MKGRYDATCNACTNTFSCRRDNLKRHFLLKHAEFLKFVLKHKKFSSMQESVSHCLKMNAQRFYMRNLFEMYEKSAMSSSIRAYAQCLNPVKKIEATQKISDDRTEAPVDKIQCHDRESDSAELDKVNHLENIDHSSCDPDQTRDEAHSSLHISDSFNETGIVEDPLCEETKKFGSLGIVDDPLCEETKKFGSLGHSMEIIQTTQGDIRSYLGKFETSHDSQVYKKFYCTTCESIHSIKTLVKNELNKCACVGKHCCCKETLIELHSEISMKLAAPTDTLEENFFFQIVSGKTRYFCISCHRSSSLKLSKSSRGDWATVGIICEKRYLLRAAMRHHLQSAEHKRSLNHESFSEKIYKTTGLPTPVLREKCTENACVVAQLMVAYNLPYGFYSDFIVCIDKILSNMTDDSQFVNPLGNINHSDSTTKKLLISCYDAHVQKMAQDFSTRNMITKQQPKFMLSADMGTCTHDVERQALVVTYIDDKGYPAEKLISVSAIRDRTAAGAANHIKDNVASILPLKDIAIVCTDGASVYTGHRYGMMEFLREWPEFSNNIVYLPDLCHKTERLFKATLPEDLKEVLKKSNFIVKLACKPSVSRILQLTAKILGLDLFAFKKVSETRYSEYLFGHIESVLRNLSVLLKSIPIILQGKECHEHQQDLLTALGYAGDPLFVAKLLNIKNVFAYASKMEKAAQLQTYGPFDYVDGIQTLKDALENKLSSPDNDAMKLLDTYKLDYQYAFGSQICCSEIDFNAVHRELTNVSWEPRNEDARISEKTSYRAWVATILQDFDTYLKPHDAIVVAVRIFKSTSDIEEKIKDFKTLAMLFDICLENCSSNCEGMTCLCFNEEVKRFFKHLEEKDLTLQNPKNVIAYFLSSENFEEVQKLKIINVARILELIQLLKSSQSATERAFSTVKKFVENRFENIYKQKADLVDMVNIQTVLKNGTNIYDMDSKAAARKFVEAGHKSLLMKTKSVYCKSKNVLTKYRNAGKGVKRKQKSFQTSKIKKAKYDVDLSDDSDNSPAPANQGDDNTPALFNQDDHSYSQPLNFDHATQTLPKSSIEVSVLREKSTHKSRSVLPKKACKKTTQVSEELKKKRRERLSIFAFAGKTSTSTGFSSVSSERCVSSPTYQDDSMHVKDSTADVSSIKVLWCVCKNNDKGGMMIQCSNEQRCKSYQERVHSENAYEGDWFHLSCLKIKPKSNFSENWLCPKCVGKKPNQMALLKKMMGKENRKICSVKKDGNCLYSSLAYHLYGMPQYHEAVRERICSDFEKIIMDEHYHDMWNSVNSLTDKELEDPNKRLLYKIANYYRYSIAEQLDIEDHLSKEDLLRYIKTKKQPLKKDYGLSEKEILSRYGSAIDLLLFSFSEKKDVWLLKPVILKDVQVGFRWELFHSYKHSLSGDHRLMTESGEDFICLLYENYGREISAHYSPILPVDGNKPFLAPLCKIYETSDVSLQKFICKHPD